MLLIQKRGVHMNEILMQLGYTEKEADLFSYFQNYGSVSIVEDIKQSIEVNGKIMKEEE